MGLTARTLWILRHYWADRLSVSPAAFETSGETIGSANEGGVQFFRRNGASVIGVPDSCIEAFEQQIDGFKSTNLEDPDAIGEWLDGLKRVDRVLDPTFYAYTDRESFAPIDSSSRVWALSDKTAYEDFRAAVSEEEWEQGGSKFSAGNTVGLFVNEELVAIAGYEIWDDVIAHIAVVTHPNRRSEGYGQAVVSRETEHALSAGFLPQYRTLDEWPWSISLAQSVGYQRFATVYLGICR